MSKNPKTNSYDVTKTSSLIALISEELDRLSGDLANVPFPAGAKLSIKELEVYQNIDFCSQKIADFSSVLKLVSDKHSGQEALDIAEIQKAAKLEFTHSLLKQSA